MQKQKDEEQKVKKMDNNNPNQDEEQNPSEIVEKIDNNQVKEKKEGAIQDGSTGSTEKSSKNNVEITSTKVDEGTSVPDVAEILVPSTEVTPAPAPAPAPAEIPDDAFELPPEFDIPDVPCSCDRPRDCNRCKVRITTLLSRYNRSQKLWDLFSRVADNEIFSYSDKSVGEVLAEVNWMDNGSLLNLRLHLHILNRKEAKQGSFKIEDDGSFTL